MGTIVRHAEGAHFDAGLRAFAWWDRAVVPAVRPRILAQPVTCLSEPG